MNNTILLIILFSYLRKALDTKNTNRRLHKQLLAAMFIFIALAVLSATLKPARPYVTWVSHATMLALIFTILRNSQFRPVKLFLYAFLPLAIIDIVSDVTALISPKFYDDWENYFAIAAICSLVWMTATLIVNSRQRKAMLKEKERMQQLEREAKLAAEMKLLLEQQVAERTAELLEQKGELQKTLEELKAAQVQLVQNEKMASLGELTAGIAHEIQNPLNFVNNFSEVNKELLEEMNDAIAKGDYEEVKALAADISGNQEKINFHGRRADGIVKGMLQHSRSSTGQKEPTDINALCDEYLRLSYHGLRAKDKTFNAKFETVFDSGIGKINVVPQDIGRVILNLINNAFYAVNEKRKTAPGGYEPTVTVSTKKEIEKVIITVADNGNGIPAAIKEKIFQPFFTTKPTGQGTGLGLSLSYDIIKAHEGEMKVETKMEEGTKFIVTIKSNT